MGLDAGAAEHLSEIAQNQKAITETLKIHGEWLQQMGECVLGNRTVLGEQMKANENLYALIRTARTETARLAQACGFSIAFEGDGESALHREDGHRA